MSNKLDKLKLIVKNKSDVLVITETKFTVYNRWFRQPYRVSRNRDGMSVMIFVGEGIPGKLQCKGTFHMIKRVSLT